MSKKSAQGRPSVGKSLRPSRVEMLSSFAAEGLLNNASTLVSFSEGILGRGDTLLAAEYLRDEIRASIDGDLRNPETLLNAQALVLNAIFNELVRRSALSLDRNMQAADTYMRLALRAQNQCRASLESLARIKNPNHVAFVKQTNIASGHQQVNNAMQVGEDAHLSRAGSCKSAPIELLEQKDAEWLDSGEESATSRGHPKVAPMGKVDGA